MIDVHPTDQPTPQEKPKPEVIVNSDIKQLCDTIKIVGAMICISIIELAALKAGHNGILITGSIGAIAGLGGYKLAQKKFQATIEG